MKKLDLEAGFRKTEGNFKGSFIKISDDTVAEWCLALTLVRFGLLDQILISGTPEISIRLASDDESIGRRGTVIETEERTEVVLNANELDYWLFFYLEYYRDGVASVPHIDSQLHVGNPNNQGAFVQLVLTAESSKPPISLEEAIRLLKLDEDTDFDTD
jgi:hypothetical protein